MTDHDLNTVIHTLRNQLNNIAMNAELAKLEISMFDLASDATLSVERAIDCLESILSQCHDSAELVSSLSQQQLNPNV
jgi:signal transduction histidine kinase